MYSSEEIEYYRLMEDAVLTLMIINEKNKNYQGQLLGPLFVIKEMYNTNKSIGVSNCRKCYKLMDQLGFIIKNDTHDYSVS